MSTKSCGGCKHFERMSSKGAGLCMWEDASTTMQLSARGCKWFKGIQYTRPKKQEIKQIILKEINL